MAERLSLDALLGAAPAVENLREQIRRLAPFDTPGSGRAPTVLLQGETGTGKGLVARVLHDSGPRAHGPFIDVNCAAIPDTMLEAELFGFEPGAFTDAKRSKPGLFEAASGGTLFLDEIDSLPLALQGKVLTAIEEKRIRRLGAVAPQAVDVKLVAATHGDLSARVAGGTLRADLYHRLAVLVFIIPPLRARGTDVALLAQHYLRTSAAAHGVPPKRLNDAARDWMLAHPWPGNVRELAYLMERVTLLHPAEVVDRNALESLATAATVAPMSPPQPSRVSGAPAVTASDAADEAAGIRLALARSGGNVVRAARVLGLGRNALRYRMRRLGIERPDDAAMLASDLPPPVAQATRRGEEPGPSPDVAASWEQKPAAILTVSLTFPAADAPPDYEPWTAAMRWDRAIAEHIEGFGGVLVRRTPSSFLAVFGVPRALEQSAQRAVQAALVLRRGVEAGPGERPELRAAVHLGEVRIDVGSADPLAWLFPIGDAFTLPERLLGHAGNGEVLISGAVGRRLERTWEMRARDLQLGSSERDRLTAYGVLRRQPGAPAASAGASTTTAFVGRERELDQLWEAFSRAAQGHGQIVFLVGDAGIGKSRVLAEFSRRLAAEPHGWIEGHCAPYATRTPFFPIVDGVRRHLGIDDHDGEDSAARKIRLEIERLGGDLAWTEPFIRQLLSLQIDDAGVQALDAASRRSEMFRALAALQFRTAAAAPLVVAIEDLHWVDSASEEFLAFVGDAIPTMRILLVLSHRTGYRHPFPDRSFHTRIALAPLSERDSAAMVRAALGAEEISDAVNDLIARKAEGNPFFVEELSKSLYETGALRREGDGIVLAQALGEFSVPDTIQDVLVARIDRLAEESRRAIQVASVIGREFALRLLARITESGEEVRAQVEELRSLELIYETALHPELAYMFKHALTHDVAYESVMVNRRRTLHRTIGRTIEELYGDRLAEHYETLAHHFLRGEDWEKALHYFDCSSQKAADTHANAAAAAHCRTALTIAERLGAEVADERRERLAARLGRACSYLSEFAASAAAYEDAARWATSAESRSVHLSNAAFNHFWAHHYEAARGGIEAARAVARAAALPAAESMADVVEGFAGAVHDADVQELDRRLHASVDICARHPQPEIEAFARFPMVMVAEWSGAYADAVRRAEQALALGRRLRRSDVIIFTIWFLGKARCCLGDYGGALALLGEAEQLCQRIGDRAWRSRMLNTIGWCLAEIGAPEQARDYNERAAALARQIGDPEIISNAAINLALNHLALGDTARAAAHLEPIEAALTQPGDPWMRWRYALHVRHTRGAIHLVTGNPARACEAAAAELHGARTHGVPKVEARALTLQAAALLGLEQPQAAEDAARQALAVAERIGYRRGVWESHRLLAAIGNRRGDTRLARRHIELARAAAEAAAQSLTDRELSRRLVATATGDALVATSAPQGGS